MNDSKNGLMSVILIIVIIVLIFLVVTNANKIFNIKKTESSNVTETEGLDKYKNFDSKKISEVMACGSYSEGESISMECNTLEVKDANSLLRELDKIEYTKSVTRDSIFTMPGTVTINYNDDTSTSIIISFDGVLYVNWDTSSDVWKQYQLSNLNYLSDYTEMYIK